MARDLQPGEVFADKLEVIRRIAGGGMGSVYEVKHLLTHHHRALKIVAPAHGLKRRYVERLLREASVAGRLNSPYVVETLDAGTLEDGTAYLLMELLAGVALLDVVEQQSPLDVDRIVRIVMQVCEGIAVAHAAGIVHRDLKPENIFLVRDVHGEEQVKILDFGISRFKDLEGREPSRLTTEGSVIGTPFYMSPEQATGNAVDERSDVYALGVILYEALTGKLPFVAETTGALFVKIGTGEYLPLKHRRRDLDPTFAEVVEKTFHRDPTKRFQTALELRDALVPWSGGARISAPARPVTQAYAAATPRAPTRQGVGPTSDEHAMTMDAGSLAEAERISSERVEARRRSSDDVIVVPDAAESPGEIPSIVEDVPAPTAVTTERPPPGRGKRIGPVVVGVGLAVGFAIGLAVVFSGGGGGGDTPRPEATADHEPPPQPDVPAATMEAVEAAPTAEIEETAAAAEPATMTSPAPAEAAVEVEEEAATPGMRSRAGMRATMSGRTPAEQAGLEGNPYDQP